MLERWMRELVGDAPPAEPDATCDRCPMVGTGEHAFARETKCCTYLPELHNFLVGGVLADPAASDEGRASVRARIARRTAVTPLGLGRPRSYLLLYDEGGVSTFGRSHTLRCPHYVDGRCGVWGHRESTCATWFCKHARGRVGAEFWSGLHRALVLVERAVAWWCLVELGVPTAVLGAVDRSNALARKRAPLDASDVDGAQPADYEQLWGAWVGREEALYLACAERARELSWAQAAALAGVEGDVRAAIVRERYAMLGSEALPERLTVARFDVLGVDAETCRISGYSRYDAIAIPHALFQVLPRFDGRPTRDVLDELAGEGIEIEAALVRRLVDLQVLADADAP